MFHFNVLKWTLIAVRRKGRRLKGHKSDLKKQKYIENKLIACRRGD